MPRAKKPAPDPRTLWHVVLDDESARDLLRTALGAGIPLSDAQFQAGIDYANRVEDLVRARLRAKAGRWIRSLEVLVEGTQAEIPGEQDLTRAAKLHVELRECQASLTSAQTLVQLLEL